MPDKTETSCPASEAETSAAPRPKDAQDQANRIDADAGLSPVVEQQGGAAIANIGKRNASELFRPD